MLVRTLVEAGARLSLKNDRGRTLLYLALYSQPGMMGKFLESRASLDIESRDLGGKTALLAEAYPDASSTGETQLFCAEKCKA